ncbi:MAG TPA: helix-turn-helix transcriptional regulator [Trebonia sp.]|nr:helix-turn-helix transcriptional regulator [Trebonia sp.]
MSDPASSPTTARRALALQLRQLRTDAGLTVAQASEASGVSESKITKIELAHVRVSGDDLATLAKAYGGVSKQHLSQLQGMVRTSSEKEWWERRDLKLPPKLDNYLRLEAVATELRAYDPSLIHGLVQTADYARTVIKAGRPDLLAHEVQQLVDTRVRRQEVLTRTSPPPLTLWFVMDEAVLRRQIGGRDVMIAQLQKLIEASERPNINLLVMPDSLGAHAGLGSPLAILQFETGTRPVAYIEGHGGNLYMEKDDDLRRCHQTFTHILASAPSPEQSLALITQISEEMRS